MPAPSLTAALKTQANRLGFELAGACPAVTPNGIERFYEWLSAGYAGEVHYLSDRAEAYEHPRHVLDGACAAHHRATRCRFCTQDLIAPAARASR